MPFSNSPKLHPLIEKRFPDAGILGKSPFCVAVSTHSEANELLLVTQDIGSILYNLEQLQRRKHNLASHHLFSLHNHPIGHQWYIFYDNILICHKRNEFIDIWEFSASVIWFKRLSLLLLVAILECVYRTLVTNSIFLSHGLGICDGV